MVFGEQDHLAVPLRHVSVVPRQTVRRTLAQGEQHNDERGPAIKLRVHPLPSTMLFNDTVDDGKPESRSLFTRLRCKEGLEDTCLHFR